MIEKIDTLKWIVPPENLFLIYLNFSNIYFWSSTSSFRSKWFVLVFPFVDIVMTILITLWLILILRYVYVNVQFK